uniref:Immunoglobulin V-set domain-containing protein n=1 Tax=Cyanistes caeruleus TaxID=156563 RepID=A0A8C0V0J0_CYACU
QCKQKKNCAAAFILQDVWNVIPQREVVHALPGADVTLLCVFPKPPTTHIIQTQWSKTDGSPSTKIAVFHPTYGTHYFTGDDTVSLCSTNPNATSECNWWALHLENVTVSLSGQYEYWMSRSGYGGTKDVGSSNHVGSSNYVVLLLWVCRTGHQ